MDHSKDYGSKGSIWNDKDEGNERTADEELFEKDVEKSAEDFIRKVRKQLQSEGNKRTTDEKLVVKDVDKEADDFTRKFKKQRRVRQSQGKSYWSNYSRFSVMQSFCLIAGLFPVFYRCLNSEGMVDILTFLPFACIPLVVMVNIFFTSEDRMREMNATTFRLLASASTSLIPRTFRLDNLVEEIYLSLIMVENIYAFLAFNTLVIFLLVLKRVPNLKYNFAMAFMHAWSLLVLVLVFVSLLNRVVEEPANSLVYKLSGWLIIVLFSMLPWVRVGWQLRRRVIFLLSAYFLAFTLGLFLNKSQRRWVGFITIDPMDSNLVACIYVCCWSVFVYIIIELDGTIGSPDKIQGIIEIPIPPILREWYERKTQVIRHIYNAEDSVCTQLDPDRPIAQEILDKEDCMLNDVQNEMTSELGSIGTLGSHHINSELSASSSGGTVIEEGEIVGISHKTDSVPANIASEIKDYMLGECIRYCSLFPADYEFTRDTLVWSWIAAALIINPLEKHEMEETAMWCFGRLLMREFILPCGYDRLSDQIRYKFGNDRTILDRNQKYGNSLDNYTDLAKLEHVSLILEEIDEVQFNILKHCSNLKTLLLHKCYGSKIENLLNSLFLELKLLTLIDLSCTNVMHLPSSVENLTALEYLDMSQTPIRWLPESIGSLCNLETLVLLGCLSLCGLPRSICKLINLQHLELDIARQLQSTPTGIGNLVNLQSLRTFVVGRKDGNGIIELMSMNKLKGSLCILKLENILNKDEAQKARLHDKKCLTKIEFLWSDLENDEVVRIEEEILENLRPHDGLQELNIVFYSGGVFPSWISDPSFDQMVNITLSGCRFCEKLPSFGELPSLKFLSFFDMDAVVDIDSSFCRKHGNQDQHNAFPQLEKLSFDGMSVLEEWTGVEKGDFPCLVQLVIKYCPNLVSLPSLSNFESLEILEIISCPELPCLPEGGVPSSVKCPMVKDCPKFKI